MKKKFSSLLLLTSIITSIFCFTLTAKASSSSPAGIDWDNIHLSENSDSSVVNNLKNNTFHDIYNGQYRYEYLDSNRNKLFITFDKNNKLVSYEISGYYFKFDDGITAGFTPDQVKCIMQGYHGLKNPEITSNDIDIKYTYKFNNKKIIYSFNMGRLVQVTVS